MRVFAIAILLMVMPATCFSQVTGISGQLTDFEKKQFSATLQLPIPYRIGLFSDNVCWLLSGGFDYVGGSSTVSGLNIKPVSFYVATIDSYFEHPATLMLGADAGYNINFTHGNDGIVLTPHIHADYKMFYMKLGYDYNTFYNEGQFFIRLGVGLCPGLFKMINR